MLSCWNNHPRSRQSHLSWTYLCRWVHCKWSDRQLFGIFNPRMDQSGEAGSIFAYLQSVGALGESILGVYTVPVFIVIGFTVGGYVLLLLFKLLKLFIIRRLLYNLQEPISQL